ncbi:MAG: HAMP domain-containing histidine kinase [Sulfurospirillum sp.]|nr:HAMP domain-containing histidine kinase [Sulfurospirillum sp.]
MLELILFFYGLFFFSLGVVIFSTSPKESNFFYAKKIWLLAMFGLTHAFVEWISLYVILYPEFKEKLLWFEVCFLFASFIFLFEFSRFMMRFIFENQQSLHFEYHFFSPWVIYPLIFAILFFMVFQDPQLKESIVAVRYTFGFWGSLLLGIGLYMYGKTLKKLNHAKDLEYYFKILGIVFVFYAFFSGIVVPRVEHFPSNLINTEIFKETFGITHYFFRCLCAFLIAIFSIKALKIFDYEMMEQLAESSRQIQEFSANASHQLKTPLTSMQLQIDVMLNKQRSVAEYQEVLMTIKKETMTLQKLVTTLLMLAKVRNFQIKSSFEPIEIDSIILDILGEYMPIARIKHISLHVENLEATLFYGSKELIRILIVNLLDNAIKYTPEGKNITLSLKAKRLFIKDEGEGIPKDKHQLIFDKFYQVHKKNYQGTSSFGLGLALAKKIAKIHSIKIDVQNNKDIGATFSVYF